MSRGGQGPGSASSNQPTSTSQSSTAGNSATTTTSSNSSNNGSTPTVTVHTQASPRAGTVGNQATGSGSQTTPQVSKLIFSFIDVTLLCISDYFEDSSQDQNR